MLLEKEMNYRELSRQKDEEFRINLDSLESEFKKVFVENNEKFKQLK